MSNIVEYLDLEAVQELLSDLGYDYDRFSKGGQACYNLLCRHLGVPEMLEVPPASERHWTHY